MSQDKQEEKGIQKEQCFLCLKELPYREYVSDVRNWNAQYVKKTVLVQDQCSELEIELKSVTYSNAWKVADNFLVIFSQKKYVHKNCAEELLGHEIGLERGLVLLGKSFLRNGYGHKYIKDDAYLKIRRPK